MKAKSLLFITICFINGFVYAQNKLDSLSNLNQYFSNNCLSEYNNPDPDSNTHKKNCYADIWGFRDDDGREYAILGVSGFDFLDQFPDVFDGFSFIDITDPMNPVEVRFIAGAPHFNRDAKIYTDGSGNKYAYLVSDGAQANHLQIVDLSGLPDSVSLVNTFTTTFNRVHNLYIDVQSKRLFLCSTRVPKGIIMLDISNPANPVVLDTYNGVKVHDVYVKNDTLFACDVSSTIDKSIVKIFDISANTFNFLTEHIYDPIVPPDPGEAHSVWLTEDGNHMVVLAERGDRNAKFWNIQDIFNIPSTPEDEFRKGNSTVHNAFIKGNFCYISHYSAGLVVLDISDINNVIEVGYFDTYPTDSTSLAYGAWGVFPFLPSCNIIVSDMQTGLYVLTFPQDLNLQNVTIAAGEEQGYVAKNTITATNFIVESGARSTLVAKDEVVLGGESVIEGEFIMRTEDPCAQSNFQSQRIGRGNTSDNKEENQAFMNEVNKIINGNYLSANYPNPFVQSTSIVYSLKESGPAVLSVYNAFGKKIAELVKSGNHAKGIHHVNFLAADLPEGVYFYTLRAGDHIETKKMSIIK